MELHTAVGQQCSADVIMTAVAYSRCTAKNKENSQHPTVGSYVV